MWSDYGYDYVLYDDEENFFVKDCTENALYGDQEFDAFKSSLDDDQYAFFDKNCTPTTILATLREPEEDTSTGWLALQLLWLVEVERINKKECLPKDDMIMDTLDDLECNPQDRSCIPACALSRHKLLLSHDDGATMLVALIRSYRARIKTNGRTYTRLDLKIPGPVLLVVLLQAALDVGIGDALAALIRVGANVHSSPGCSSKAKKSLRPVLAAACVDARVLRVLLAAKADVNATFEGITALTLACELEHLDVVNILLAANADPHVGRFKHQTVFEIALRKVNDRVLHALLKRRPDLVSSKKAFDRVLDRVIEIRGKNLLELLLAMKWPIDTLPEDFIQPAFVHAARCGSITAACHLLDAKADINGNDGTMELPTALIEAARHGHDDLVTMLLERGACVHTTDMNSQTDLVEKYPAWMCKSRLLAWRRVMEPLGWTPLHAAARAGFASVVKLLLDANADAKAVDRYGSTPLVVALYSGNVEVVRMLMDECGDVDMNGVIGRKALKYAVEHGHADIVKVLLDQGVDPNARDDAGHRLLMVAADNGHAGVMQALIDIGADVNVRNRNGESALSLATKHGSFSVVKMLLQKRATVNSFDARDYYVLYHAAIRGNIDVLQTLIDNGVYVRNDSGQWALLAALARHKADAAKVLIDAGVDIFAKHTRQNLSSLCVAVQKGDIGWVRGLLAAKANVEKRSSEGKTPLIYAVEKLSRLTVKTLLTAKADVHAVDREGNTPLMIALKLDRNPTYADLFIATDTRPTGGREHEGWEIARWLLSAKAEVDVAKTFGRDALHDAVRKNDIKRVRTLVQAKANLGTTDARGATPLMLAIQCSQNSDGVVHLLLSASVVRKALDRFSDTLLLDAIAEGRRDVAKVLIDAGVDVNVCNDNGDSAVMCAIATRQMSVLRTLLASGADADIANNQQVTPMQYAESQDNMVAVRALSMKRDSPDPYNYIPDPRKFWASAAEYREATAYLLSRLEKGE